ncbi:hypothetical protein Zmor_026689 [Zophobas morio]|uniref:Uncharacterized protein n=1 Tax=Zophobas morio TaxID=2755281 RepID=A0AA38HVY4_9CUCU|nr:hypothetical protein Zmor_026689 [Zophobas morio]
MQIRKLLRTCGVKLKIMAVNRSTTKIPLGRSSTSGVWGYRSGLFSPHDGDSIYRKPTAKKISMTNMPTRLSRYDRQSAVGSRLLGQIHSVATSATAPYSIQTCSLVQVTW